MPGVAFVAVLDPASGALAYVSAGHDYPLLRANSALEEILPTGPAIGAMDDAEFALGELLLNSGDLLFCYTDGLTDLRNPTGDLFGGEQLRALVKGKAADVSALVAATVAAVDSFAAGAVQYDDITILGLFRK